MEILWAPQKKANMAQMFRSLTLTGNLSATDIIENFRKINIWAIDQSRQNASLVDPDDNSMAGSVTSLALSSSGSTKRAGDITLTAGTGMAITNSARDFSFATSVSSGNPVDVLPNNSAASGSGAPSAANHVHEADTALWTGDWATTADIGVANSFLRSDGNLIYPEALYSGTETLTLTDSGSDLLLTSSLTDGKVELHLARTDNAAGDVAFRVLWDRDRDVGAGTQTAALPFQAVTEWAVTDTATADQRVGWVAADFNPNHTSSIGPGLIVVRPAGSAHTATRAWIGSVSEDDLDLFSGLEITSGSSANFYLAGSAALGFLTSGIQILSSLTGQTAIDTQNNKALILDIRYTASSFGTMLMVRPERASAEPGTGDYLMQVASSIVTAGDTPRFSVWGEGRGVVVKTGDYTCLEASKGLVVTDATNYSRVQRDSDGTIFALDIGTSAP